MQTFKLILGDLRRIVVAWVLHSRRRFLSIVGVLVVAVIVASAVSKHRTPATVAATPAPPISAASTALPGPAAPATTAPAGASQPAPATTRPAAPSATTQQETAATGFITHWARPNMPATQWVAALKPYATPRLLTELATTDPANVPVTTITGHATPGASNDGYVNITFKVDIGIATVTMHKSAGAWLADQIDVS